MTNMHTLAQQQRALLEAITAEAEPAALETLLMPAPGGQPPRLAIYRHAYRARLVAALADNYTVLQRALGDEAFEALGQAYVDACPSRRPSIRWYGDRLADFMTTREDLVPHAALVDIARMDWALREAFDAADAASVEPAALATLPAEAFATLRLAFHPSLRQVALQWAIEPVWRALRAHDPDGDEPEPEVPEPQAHAHVLLAWRQGLETQWRALPALEAMLLQQAIEGAPFAALCEHAAEAFDGDADQAAVAAASALQQWLQDGIVTALLA